MDIEQIYVNIKFRLKKFPWYFHLLINYDKKSILPDRFVNNLTKCVYARTYECTEISRR